MSEGNGKITEKQRGFNDRSLANLKPFPKGVSGNPGGRRKGPTLMSAILDELDAKGGKARKESAKAHVAQMKRGSIAHAKEVIQHEEGSAPPDGQMRVVVVFVKSDADGNPSPN